MKTIGDLGVPYVELYRGHIAPNSTEMQIRDALKVMEDSKVKPIAFGVEGFSKNHDNNKKLFEFGKALGVQSLSADPDPDSFDSLDKLCAEYKIAIAIHPHGPSGKGKHRWYSAETIMKAVKDHHELIGACLDTGHLIRMEQLMEPLDPIAEAKVMGKRNFGFHLKDHDNKKKEDVIFGKPEGKLDVLGLLKTLKGLEYKGYLAIEYEAKPQDPTEDVKACVAVVKEAIAKLG
jgi:inosose dehydratase